MKVKACSTVRSIIRKIMATSCTEKMCGFARKAKNHLKINKYLLTTKALVFFYWGGNFALSNYMTLHMDSIGLTLAQITTINSVLAWTSLFGGPLIGALADRTGRYKQTLATCLTIAIVLHILLLLAVPRYSEITLYEKPNFVMQNSSILWAEVCGGGRNVSLWNATMCVIVGNETSPLIEQFHSCWRQCTEQAVHDIPSRSDELFCSLLNQSSSCSDTCLSSENFTVCRPYTMQTGDRTLTFALYFAIRLLTGFVMNVCFCMVDTTMIQMTVDHKGDLGFTRMYIQVAMMSLPPVSGLLIDHLSQQNGYNDFSVAFYIFGGMQVMALVILLFSRIKVKAPQRQVWKGLGTLVLQRDPKIIGFLLVIFFIGMCIGYMEGFLFLFLDKELHAPKWLLGLTNTVAGVSAIPFVAFASVFVRYFGHRNILSLATVTYGFRFLGYSLTTDPYWVLPIEALECFSNALMWTVVQMYMAVLAHDYLATFQGLASGIHSGLGIGLGNMLSGLLIGHYGTRFSFQVFSGACFGVGLLYFLATCFSRRRAGRSELPPDSPSEKSLVQARDLSD
ncbi:uncharacterized protein LOC129595838 [Paramacrobiotus metropolitanus]|uniref:uncharacterized protein LOC129595838 n=1 Tax=Paramacrobiotus metropolitanus TaxID=2943436 RepID=UPI0024465812|nr:uncharacterized protein LOC129595838 [Paramacrobiotus metropolitanus]